jgi:hypothetical protein
MCTEKTSAGGLIPHIGDPATAKSGHVERTGKLVDFDIIRTSPGDEYVIARSTLRKPDWGTYCRHGLKIIEAEPAEHTFHGPRPLCTLGKDDWGHQCAEDKRCPACYPTGRKVQPWPCKEDGCAEADFDQAQELEIAEHWDAINDLMRTQYE